MHLQHSGEAELEPQAPALTSTERRTANEKERMRTILYQPDGPYKGIGGQRP
jgi:hypothetical protein